MLEQQFVNALSLGCVYALFALGFTLVFGVLGVINLAHGAVFMVGAYAALTVVQNLALPLWAGLVAAFVVAGLTGVIIDYLVLKPLRKRNAPHLIPMIATIGVGIILNNAAQGIFGASNLRFHGTVPEEVIEVAGLHLTVIELGIIFMSFALMAVLMFVMRRTQFGRALRHRRIAQAAWLLGINVENCSSPLRSPPRLGGVAGVLIGLYSNALFPLMGQPMLLGIAVIILGGMGDIRGAMLGGLFLGFAEVLSVAYIGSTMRDAVAFGLLFLILLVRPQACSAKWFNARRKCDERIRKFLGHLWQPGADAGHQCPAGPVHLADAGLRHACHGQCGLHGHRRLRRRLAHHELRRVLPCGAGRHAGAGPGGGADRPAHAALVRGLPGWRRWVSVRWCA